MPLNSLYPSISLAELTSHLRASLTSQTAGIDSHGEDIDTERLENAMETSTGRPEATDPLKAPEEGPVLDSAARPILNDAAASGDVSQLLEVSQAFCLFSRSRLTSHAGRQ